MWVNFTELARKAILLAQNEANQNRSDSVCVGHLICGVLSCEDETIEFDFGDEMSQDAMDAPSGFVARLMQVNRVDVPCLNTQLKKLMAQNEGVEGVEPKLTKNAKRVLERAANEARRARSKYIGPEHLLLGALRFNSPVATLLSEHNLDLATVRDQLIRGEKVLPEYGKIISDELQIVLENSRREATLSSCGCIYNAHLLLCILNDSELRALLQRRNVQTEALQTNLQARLISDSEVAQAKPKYSDGAKRVLDLARQAAFDNESPTISPKHLFFVLAQPRRSWRQWRDLVKPPHANDIAVEIVLRDLPQNLRFRLHFFADVKTD